MTRTQTKPYELERRQEDLILRTFDGKSSLELLDELVELGRLEALERKDLTK